MSGCRNARPQGLLPAGDTSPPAAGPSEQHTGCPTALGPAAQTQQEPSQQTRVSMGAPPPRHLDATAPTASTITPYSPSASLGLPVARMSSAAMDAEAASGTLHARSLRAAAAGGVSAVVHCGVGDAEAGADGPHEAPRRWWGGFSMRRSRRVQGSGAAAGAGASRRLSDLSAASSVASMQPDRAGRQQERAASAAAGTGAAHQCTYACAGGRRRVLWPMSWNANYMQSSRRVTPARN